MAPGTHTVSRQPRRMSYPIDGRRRLLWLVHTRKHKRPSRPRLDEKIGTDILGIPGTNGTRRIKGGWPRFEIDNYTTMGINEDFMPYYKRDPQFQYVANVNWTKGTHDMRFGIDFYRRDEPDAGTVRGRRIPRRTGRVHLHGWADDLARRRGANQFNSYAAFLLGLPARSASWTWYPMSTRFAPVCTACTVQDRWNATSRLISVSSGLRWEYFPFATRADRGLERYDFATNQMLVCGVGQSDKDCGVHVSKALFAPRVGIAYRRRIHS